MLNPHPTVRGLRSLGGGFVRSTRGVAGVEFAIVAPFLVTLFLGTVETARYLGVQKRVHAAAGDIALAVSASDEEISGGTLWRLYHTLPALIPDVISDMRLSGETDWSQQARMNVTFVKANRVQRRNCSSWCKSRSMVLWSYGRDRRKCGEWRTESKRDQDGLPRLFWDEGTNFFAVEINYTFEPLFVRFIKKTIEIESISFAPPKYHQEIEITNVGDADVRLANVCTA